jgi:hypothetical protein
MAKFGWNNIPECEVCFRQGHLAATCVIRGPNFVPADIQRHAQQYNLTHGDSPLEPLRSWTKRSPPGATFKKSQPLTSFTAKPPVKPTIKYLLANSTREPIEIDPSKISAVHSSDVTDEVFHEAQEEVASSPIDPTIKTISSKPSRCSQTILIFLILLKSNNFRKTNFLLMHIDGRANIFAIKERHLLFRLYLWAQSYTQASGLLPLSQGVGITLFCFPGTNKMYPWPTFYVPDNPVSIFSPGALKYYIGFKSAAS